MENKSYELHLPVFKQGDDLSHSIQETKSLQEAFEKQAECYKLASDICLLVEDGTLDEEENDEDDDDDFDEEE